MNVSVFVIEPETTMREAMVKLLRETGLRTRAFSSDQSFIDHLPLEAVACVITGLQSPTANRLDLVQWILDQRGEAWPVVIVTDRGDVASAVDMMKRGVADYIERPFTPERLLTSVATCVERLERRRPRIEARARNRRNLSQLTSRERQVFDALTAGLSNKEIAGELAISPRTVEIFRAKVMAKLAAPNLPALVRIGLDAN